MNTIKIILPLLLFITITVTGCDSSSNLSRSKAEKMIKESSVFLEPNMNASVVIVVDGLMRLRSNDYQHINKELAGFKEKNLISSYNFKPDTTPGYGGDYYVTKINLTDDGKKYAIGNWDNGDWRGYGGRIDRMGRGVYLKACQRELIKVTGIKQSEAGVAEVEYEWTYGSPTPFSSLAKDDNLCKVEMGRIQNDRAVFTLYDDGWRLVKFVRRNW